MGSGHAGCASMWRQENIWFIRPVGQGGKRVTVTRVANASHFRFNSNYVLKNEGLTLRYFLSISSFIRVKMIDFF